MEVLELEITFDTAFMVFYFIFDIPYTTHEQILLTDIQKVFKIPQWFPSQLLPLELSHHHLSPIGTGLPSSPTSSVSCIYTEVRAVFLKGSLITSFSSPNLRMLSHLMRSKVSCLGLQDQVSLSPDLLLFSPSFTLLQPPWHSWGF